MSGADRERLDALLRSCVECALCLPHCATYLATGDEANSPRGRLLLLREVLDRPDGPDDGIWTAFDLCLGCRACETACPSGVPYELFDAAKGLADAALGPPDGPLVRHLSSRPVLKALRLAGRAVRGLLAALLGGTWRARLAVGPARRLARPLGSLPATPGDAALIARLDRLSGSRTPPDARPGRRSADGRAVVLFAGCANRDLMPEAQHRLRELLDASGVKVVVPAGQDCCGALAAHSGAPHVARARRARNVAALAGPVGEAGTLLVEAAGCGLELGAYPATIADHVVDAAVCLADWPLPPLREVPLRVAYHDPCHARHGQRIVDEPRRALARIPGLEVVEPEEADVCCGSGGAYALRHPDLSESMGRRKAENLVRTGADLVVTSNPGCLGQIRDSLLIVAPELPVLPLSDLLWYASLSTTPDNT